MTLDEQFRLNLLSVNPLAKGIVGNNGDVLYLDVENQVFFLNEKNVV